LDIAPPPVSSGRIDVNESTGPDGPGFELTASLPGGNIIVNSTGGDATYSAEPSQGGVIISVSSGSVSITSSRLPGASTTLSAGESAFVDPLDINASTQVLPVPTPSAACTASSDCPASELCMNGKCETPQCFSAFALAALLGAAFVSTRGKEE
jgi:hypothetical protein